MDERPPNVRHGNNLRTSDANWRYNKIVMTAQRSHNLWILIESLNAAEFLHAKNEVHPGVANERVYMRFFVPTFLKCT